MPGDDAQLHRNTIFFSEQTTYGLTMETSRRQENNTTDCTSIAAPNSSTQERKKRLMKVLVWEKALFTSVVEFSTRACRIFDSFD